MQNVSRISSAVRRRMLNVRCSMFRPPASRAAFNLIELVISVACLLIIVTVTGLIFAHSQTASTLGSDMAKNCLSGRATLSMIVNDLQSAVADERLSFFLGPDRESVLSYGFTNSEICFVSLQHDSSDSNRAVREIHYWVQPMPNSTNRYELVRGYHSISNLSELTACDNCYSNQLWHGDQAAGGAGRPADFGVVAENVGALRFYAMDTNGAIAETYASNQLPQYVDVYLEILNEREARQAADMISRGRDCTNIVERNAKRYTARVYFNNRIGYLTR